MSIQAAEKLLTADEFLVLPNPEGKRRDLINGKVVEMSWPGGRHAKLVSKISRRIGNFVEEHHLGEVLVDAGFVLDDQRTVRAPDIAFLPKDLVDHADETRHVRVAPAVAVEVLSPSDAMGDVLEKVRWFLDHGVAQVWVVDDASKTVTVYLPDATARIFGLDDTLDAGAALPGFALRVADWLA